MNEKSRKMKIEVVSWLVWLSWLEHCHIDQKVTGSIPDQDTCPGCGFNPQSGHYKKAIDQCFSLTLNVSFSLSPLPFSLSKNNEKMSSGEDLKKKKEIVGEEHSFLYPLRFYD